MKTGLSLVARSAAALLFVLSYQTGATGNHEESQPIRIVSEDFRPYNYPHLGEARGMSSEVVQAMLKHAGLDVEVEFYPWPRAYHYAQEHPNTLIYSIARIPEREDLFEWIGVIAPYRTSLYKLADRSDLKIRTLEDARQYRIGVSRADVIKTYLVRQGFRDLEVSRKDEIALNMLAFERVDLVALDEAGLRYYTEESSLAHAQVEQVLSIDGLSGKLYVAMHRDSDPDLIDKLRASLEAVKASGQYDAIEARYFRQE